ncbi:hypothetical protein [Dyadobacter sp. BHUBP1]|uniref:hypothetical protein n=1 Tax=Dyadobacter sp. BHUBP1 TaxID=3424178 RepID=UPI003D33FBA8
MAVTNDLIPDFDDFERYYSGTMRVEEQRALEGRMLDEPLVAEAYEGYLAWRVTHSDIAGMRADLRERLHERVARERKSGLPLWVYTSAASVLLVLFAYWTFFLGDNQVVVQKDSTTYGDETATEARKPVQADDKFTKAPEPVVVPPPKIPSKPAASKTRGQAVASKPVHNPESLLKPHAFVPDALADAEVQREQIVVPPTHSDLNQPTPAQPAPDPAKALPASGTLRALGKSAAARSQTEPSKPLLVSHKTADTVPENPGEILNEVVVTGSSISSKKSPITLVAEPDQPTPIPAQGWPAYRTYLEKSTGFAATTGQVVVTFIVSSTGALSGFVANGPEELRKEAIHIISNGPAWAPARTKGFPVTSLAEIQLQFRQSQ